MAEPGRGSVPASGRAGRIRSTTEARRVLNDPDELLEVLTPDGQPTGRAKPRGAIHLEGDWHRAVHCWVVRAGRAGAELLLQRRALSRDTWPGRFDVSAAGHVRFGEEEGAAARELAEELGLAVEPGALLPVGRHAEQRSHRNGIVDREHYELSALRLDLPLAAFRPSPDEVTALAWAPAAGLAQLMAAARDELEVELIEVGQGDPAPRRAVLRRDDVVPRARSYYRRVAAAAARLVAAPRPGPGRV